MSSNPVLRHMPVPLLDPHSWKVRKEHSPAGVRVFFNIMEEWNVGPEDASLLLGVSSRYYNQLKARQEGRILNTDRHTASLTLSVSTRRCGSCMDQHWEIGLCICQTRIGCSQERRP
jgi:hypothetical protein